MQRSDRQLLRVVQLCFFCMLLTGISLSAAVQKPLQLVLYTPMDVDGNATTTSTTLRLYNPNPTPLKYTLVIGDSKATNTGADANLVVAFYGTDNKLVGPILEGNVAASASTSVRADFSHVVEAGETTAKLKCNGLEIATLKLLKDHGLPFRVSLEGNPTEKPEIDFVRGSPVDLRWKNDDAMHYPLSWEFFLKGKYVSGTTQAGPNGSTKFTVTPYDGWFSLYQSFFRSEIADGTVTVGYWPQGSAGAYPSKTIPIKARLTYLDPAVRDVLAMIAILVILAVGGFASTYVNVDLVNRIKAISIKKRIDQLARSIGESGPKLNSQLRVSLFLERGRIEATLPHGVLFTPGTAAALAQSDADTGALSIRVDWAAQIADATVRLNHAKEEGALAPSLTDQVTKALSDAQDLLKKSTLGAGELQRVQTLVGLSTNILEHKYQADEDLEKVLAARLQDLKARFTASLLATSTCTAIKGAVPIPFALLDPAIPQVGSQADRDANIRRLAIIAEMVQMQSTDSSILQCLGRQDFISLQEAEQLLRELKDGISLDDLRNEITTNPARMYFVVDRDTVRVNTPIMMKLMFNNHRCNWAAARCRIECTWNFNHKNLTEKGWEVHHYFPEAKDYSVGVTFNDINQVPITPSLQIERKVSVIQQRIQERNYVAVEIQRWAVGFVVALIGLFAGAKEKILSLDTAGAILAVFLLGFGIDMAKNLLVPK